MQRCFNQQLSPRSDYYIALPHGRGLCSSLTNVIIPESVETIGYCSFYDCTNLETITIPNNVTTIGSAAFTGCKKLVILCNDNSYAKVYAKNNNIKTHYFQHSVTKLSTTATCENSGVGEYSCNECTYTYSKAEAALGHDELLHAAKVQTCTEIGYEAYSTCSRCDYSTYTEIPALGHDMEETIIVEPTINSAGRLQCTCTTCGYIEYKEIPKLILGDTDGDGIISIKDALIALKAVANDNMLIIADMNNDGKVSLIDVIRVLKAITA